MMLPVVQAMHEVLPIQVRQTLALFVLFRLENYAQLGERAYNKVYDRVYASSYLNGISANANLYENTYTSKYNQYKTDNYTSTKALYDTATFKANVRSGIVEEKRRSDLMQRYYDQRYKDYYDGKSSFANDGTTTRPEWWEATLLNKEKSAEYALLNTYEMIELLWGVAQVLLLITNGRKK